MAEPRLELTKQTGVVSAFADMARENKPLMAAISLDQAKYLLAQIVGVAKPGAPLDVAPLYDYLKETGAPSEAIHELFLGLDRRVGNLGLQLQLPAATAALPEDVRARLAERGMGRATDAKKAPALGESGIRTLPPGEAKGRVTVTPAPAPAPAAAAPGLQPAGKPLPNKGLIAAASVAALGALAYFVAPLFAPDPKQDALKLLGPPGDSSRYVCESVQVLSGNVSCILDIDLAKGLDPKHKSKVELTRALAAAAGFKNVRFFEKATGRPLPEPE